MPESKKMTKKEELNGRYLFTAEWCFPCKQIKARLKPEHGVTIVDVEEEDELTKELGLKSVPTLIVAEAGRITLEARGTDAIQKILF